MINGNIAREQGDKDASNPPIKEAINNIYHAVWLVSEKACKILSINLFLKVVFQYSRLD